MQYTVDYFINKFEAIPEDKWCTNDFGYTGNHCALGHCGIKDYESPNDESIALSGLINILPISIKWDEFEAQKVAGLNDGHVAEYPQPTPKQRILAALYDIKKMQDTDGQMPTETTAGPEVKVKEVIRYVTVAPEILSNSAVHFSEAFN